MSHAKNVLLGSLLLSLAMFSASSYAGKPSKINYSGKGSALLGGDYRLYTVICTDSKKRKITSWKKKSKASWCVGKGSSSQCSKSQMQAAKKACK
jgi:hypothetical protein